MEEKLSSSSIHLKIPMILGMDFSCIIMCTIVSIPKINVMCKFSSCFSSY